MRFPSAIAVRIRSTASDMSPSRKGSWSGCSPARKALASSGSPYPRRTSTLAVISLTPSSRVRTLDSRCGHGRIVHVPCCIASPRYEARRTAPPPFAAFRCFRCRSGLLSAQTFERPWLRRVKQGVLDDLRTLVGVVRRRVDLDVIGDAGMDHVVLSARFPEDSVAPPAFACFQYLERRVHADEERLQACERLRPRVEPRRVDQDVVRHDIEPYPSCRAHRRAGRRSQTLSHGTRDDGEAVLALDPPEAFVRTRAELHPPSVD